MCAPGTTGLGSQPRPRAKGPSPMTPAALWLGRAPLGATSFQVWGKWRIVAEHAWWSQVPLQPHTTRPWLGAMGPDTAVRGASETQRAETPPTASCPLPAAAWHDPAIRTTTPRAPCGAMAFKPRNGTALPSKAALSVDTAGGKARRYHADWSQRERRPSPPFL